ncbi:MAG TPA: hypothetical protein ENI65_09620 [Gammaproteobacteria bacterium]|nr:hypothetical protein [Gammaproteobacteria bacterium]
MKEYNVNNKDYHDLLDAELLNVEKRSQQLTGWLLAATIVIMNIFSHLGRGAGMEDVLGFTRILSIALIAWFIGTSMLITKGVYHPGFKYLNLILQVSTVTFYIMVTAKLVDANFALSSSAPLYYLLVIGLTSLSLSPLLSLLAGGFAAGQFVVVYFLWLQIEIQATAPVSADAAWIQIVLKSLVFIMMGIAAMFIARSSRALLEKVVSQVSYEEQLNYIEEDMEQAAEIQERLISSGHPGDCIYNIETFYSPAKHVGGDYFDIIVKPDGCCLLVIADVSGKGYSAALLMSNVQAIVKTLSSQNYPLEGMVGLINQSIINTSVRGRFLTIFFMELNPDNHTMKYINCGHNRPVLIRATSEIIELEKAGPVLGVIDDYPLEITEIEFLPKDVVFAYTDGLSELRDKEGKQLGAEKIIEVLRLANQLEPEYIKQFMLALIYEHSRDAEMVDDLSFVVLQTKS